MNPTQSSPSIADFAAMKDAITSYPIDTLLRQRWSLRSFSDQRVPTEHIGSLLEAARWAPSSHNEQPWSFFVALKEDAAAFQHLLQVLHEDNAEWAQHAPVLMLAVAKQFHDWKRYANRYATHDVGLAIENLTIEATALGLGVCQMAGFYGERAREVYRIPQGYEPITAMALGYPANPNTLSEADREEELAPRARKPLSSFVFTNSWGHVAPFIDSSIS